jgi:hypothetical protein
MVLSFLSWSQVVLAAHFSPYARLTWPWPSCQRVQRVTVSAASCWSGAATRSVIDVVACSGVSSEVPGAAKPASSAAICA